MAPYSLPRSALGVGAAELAETVRLSWKMEAGSCRLMGTSWQSCCFMNEACSKSGEKSCVAGVEEMTEGQWVRWGAPNRKSLNVVPKSWTLVDSETMYDWKGRC